MNNRAYAFHTKLLAVLGLVVLLAVGTLSVICIVNAVDMGWYDGADAPPVENSLMLILFRLRYVAIGSLAVCALGLLADIGYLVHAAGRRPQDDEIHPGIQEHIPLDAYLCGAFFLFMFCVRMIGSSYWTLLDMAGFLLALLLALACLCTLSVRLRMGGWWRNTLCYWLIRLLWRACRAVWAMLPDAWAAGLGFLGYLLLMAVFVTGLGSWPLFLLLNAGALALVCIAAHQYQVLCRAADRLAAGELDQQIAVERMLPHLKSHGEALNRIGDGISAAVEARMKSERMKTELITNVSHDLKTPLTSIINYVDLLQRRPLEDPEAKEYLGVIARQANRLKKLTEDLVEAAKAASGNLAVHLDRMNVCELLNQACAEYGDPLEQASLTMIRSLPEPGIILRADGKLLWRVFDNLLGNTVKYAQPGTRVYLTCARNGSEAVIQLKNISREPLNISPDELMERFVRGDSARTSEGSGLGLSIVQGLTELNGGRFHLAVDGDLFKAELRFPLCAE